MQTDLKTLLAVSGGTFVANLLAVLLAVNLLLANVRADVADVQEDVKETNEHLHQHEKLIGHQGMDVRVQALMQSMDEMKSDLKWIRENMQ